MTGGGKKQLARPSAEQIQGTRAPSSNANYDGTRIGRLAHAITTSPVMQARVKSISRMLAGTTPAPQLTDPRDPSAQIAQRMKIRNANAASVVRGDTHDKHVVAVNLQPAAALAAHTSMTFVTSDDVLTTCVDADTHNFTETKGSASSRYNLNASPVIYLYSKENPGSGNTSNISINGVATNCQIGVKKSGDDVIQIIHLQKV